jgi:hypothetical protein
MWNKGTIVNRWEREREREQKKEIKRVQNNSPETNFHEMKFFGPAFSSSQVPRQTDDRPASRIFVSGRLQGSPSAAVTLKQKQFPCCLWVCLSHFSLCCFTDDPPFLHHWNNYTFLSFCLLLCIQIFVSLWPISSDLSFCGHYAVFSTFLSFLSYVSVGVHRIAQHLPDDRVTVDSPHVV